MPESTSCLKRPEHDRESPQDVDRVGGSEADECQNRIRMRRSGAKVPGSQNRREAQPREAKRTKILDRFQVPVGRAGDKDIDEPRKKIRCSPCCDQRNRSVTGASPVTYGTRRNSS